MRLVWLFLLLVFAISCKQSDPGKSNAANHTLDNTSVMKSKQLIDTAVLLSSFRELRDAIYRSDRNTAKHFFSFPIVDSQNNIWDLVAESDSNIRNLPSDTPIPFIEKDFDKYFDKLFSKRFIATILKIKSQDLVANGRCETIDLKEGDSTTYKMYATLDNNERKLALHLWSNTVQKDESGEVTDGGEFSIIYVFTILDDGKLKFDRLVLAG